MQVETTDPGVVKGKMSYLSPEAARGEEVDRRADIFAVGILLYEMLTGKRLFYGETDYQTVELVRAAKIPPIGPQNPRGRAGAGGDRPQVAGPAARRPLPERHRSAGRAGALPVLARPEDDPAGHRRSGAQLHRGSRRWLSGAARKPKANIIDTLLQDEIQSFTSVEFDGEGFDEGGATVATNSPLAVPGMPSGEYIDPRAWADDTDAHRRQAAAPGPNRKRTGEVRIMSETPRIPAPPPSPPPTAQRLAAPTSSRRRRGKRLPTRPDPAARPTQAGYQQVNEPRFNPTPAPDQLAQVLEPGGHAIRKMPKGLIIGVLVGALVIGAAFAAWLVRSG